MTGGANSIPATEPDRPSKPLLSVIVAGLAAAIIGAGTEILKLHAPLMISKMIFWNSPNVYLYFFCVVRGPYLLCLPALLTARTVGRRSLVLGFAFGLAAASTLAEGFLFLFMLPEVILWFRPPIPQLLPWVLLSLIGNLLVVCGSASYFWKATAGRLAFVGAGLAALFYSGAVLQLQEAGLRKFYATVEAIDRESQAAADTVRAVSWCAILHQVASGEYPADLASMDSGSSCGQPWTVSRIPDYKITFTAMRDGAGKISGFKVRAEAPPSRLRFRKDAESDDSGDVYIDPQEPGFRKTLLYPSAVSITGRMHDCITGFAEDSPASGFPAQLRGVNDCPVVLDNQWVSENSFVLGGYLFSYSPGPRTGSGKIATFNLQARCRDYAKSCLVSLYANDGADIHRTAENRAATADDPRR
jgi:hypothetical protein